MAHVLIVRSGAKTASSAQRLKKDRHRSPGPEGSPSIQSLSQFWLCRYDCCTSGQVFDAVL